MRARLGVVLIVVLLGAPIAGACPICDSDTGTAVRAGIFNDEFWRTAAAVLLPFPLLAGFVAALHFGLPLPHRRRSAGGRIPPARESPHGH